MSTMTDRRLAAGCMLGSYDGTDVPQWLLERVGEGLGGVLLFAQNIVDDAQVAEACGALRAARDDVVIAIDEEGGDVTRLDASHGSDTPCPAAFGAVDDVQLTFGAFADLGRRVKSLGIDLTLAPCADINSNPLNPIIGLRSFGTTADVVSRHVAAAVQGFRSSGLTACVKHYPGHGDTSADTHLGPARITASIEALTARELAPFAAAITAGVDAVLTAHIVVDALDSAPASLSARWTDHLRRTTGFDGAIVTDALDMDAVAQGRGLAGVADAAVLALAAGSDLLCVGSNFDASMTDTVVEAVTAALADGRLDRAALRRSCERNIALRRAPVDATLSSSCASSFVAAHAVTVTGVLPDGPFAVLECRPRASIVCFNVKWGIADQLAGRGWPTATIGEGDPIGDTCDALLSAAVQLPVVVVVRDAGVHPWQASVVEHCRRVRPALVVAEMGWPQRNQQGPTTIVTHGAARSSAQALIDRLVVKES